jgi:hypothetical protein
MGQKCRTAVRATSYEKSEFDGLSEIEGISFKRRVRP